MSMSDDSIYTLDADERSGDQVKMALDRLYWAIGITGAIIMALVFNYIDPFF